jgi:GNAT superfamily N-acetyltransferase
MSTSPPEADDDHPAAASDFAAPVPLRFSIDCGVGRQVLARELQRHEVPQLQRLWDENPLYFQTVNGRNARPGEALEEFDERPPANLSWREHWMLGLFGSDGARHGELLGTIVVVSDLVAAGAWHLALLWLPSAKHGSGLAQASYDALERWAEAQGARWMRLACVVGNTRAERFWERQGFVELKRWQDFDTGGRLNAMRVMLKPLGANTLEQYLAAVPRDRPAT